MNKTVFISSTYEDLKEYRRAIWDLLEKFNVNLEVHYSADAKLIFMFSKLAESI